MQKIGPIIFLLQFVVFCLIAQKRNTYPPITIQESSITIREVLQEITRQTEVGFSFNPKGIEANRIISFYVRRTRLKHVLEAFCAKTNLKYRFIEGVVVLNRSEEIIEEEGIFHTLSGFVTDETSGESLIGATVAVTGTTQGTITNEFGYYAFQLPAGNHDLSYSYVGYEGKHVHLELASDKRHSLALQTGAIALPRVLVELPEDLTVDRPQLGQINLKSGELTNLPEFAGESGLIKGLQSQPGIHMHSDGSAFFYARGGERDQNLIIVDDAPIYNPFHLFGFYSIVIPDFTKSIDIYKSDVPASLGDRLSSIVSIRTRDGNSKKFEFRGAINPFINRFSVETPITKEKGSIFVSARGSNFERFWRETNPDLELSFGDVIVKWNHILNERNRLFFTMILNGDNFAAKPDSLTSVRSRYGNAAASFRWNRIYGPKLFSNTTLSTGNYGYNFSFAPSTWRSSLGTLSLKSDFTHYASPHYTAKFGLEATRYFIDPGSFSLDSTIAILPEVQSNSSRKVALYYQGEWTLSEKLKLNAGLRLLSWANFGPTEYFGFDENYEVVDTFSAGEEVFNRFVHLDPRLSLRYQLDDHSQLKFSYGRYHQYLQLISNSVAPFSSSEVWLPAGPNIQPQSAFQLAVNYLRRFKDPGVEFSSALYYKKYRHQIDYRPHASTLLNPLLEGELRFGDMYSYGIELMLKKELGRLNGWFSYTFSRTIRKTRGLNEGREYPAFQDRPHDLSLMLNYRLTKRIHFSTYYTIYSGSAFSSPTGFYRFNGRVVPIFDEKNNDRLPTYQRLDFSFQFILNKREDRRFQNSLVFSLYNALGHRNVVSVNFNKIPISGSRPKLKTNLLAETALTPTEVDLIRFFPSLTYKFKF